MADNIAVTPGTGVSIAADDIGGGVLAQRVKIVWGPDGTGNDTDAASGKALPVNLRKSDGTEITFNGNGQSTKANSAPVTIASDQDPLTTQYATGANMVSGAVTTAMTGTTSTSLVAAPGAGLRNYITTIIVSNSHATVGTDLLIQDGSGGTILLVIPAAAVYGGAVITLPTPLRQPTANTALYCANVTTGASTKVSAVGFKAA